MQTLKEYFINLFLYDNWANKRIFETLKKSSSTKALLLFAHIFNSQQIWLGRIRGNPLSALPWQDKPLELLEKDIESVNKDWMCFLESSSDKELNNVIDYFSTEGVNYKSSVRDIITHVINHSTYHRAQIAKIFKKEKIQPPVTDYIAFTRS